MNSSGIVYLVGAGPGDPGLFTVRGREVLSRAEVVIYDGLVCRELLRFAPSTAEVIYGGKHDRTRCVSQDQLNALLVAKARDGKRVVRLKGGDPFVFGRGGEEAEVLVESDIPFEVVPGVSSSYSVPCYAGIPLTHHASRVTHPPSLVVTLVTGHDAPSSPSNKVDWPGLARLPGTLVVMMGLRNLGPIASLLIAHGRPAATPVAVISRGATRRQRTVVGTLGTIAEIANRAGIKPPAVTVIGEVVRLRVRLNWFEQRPLFGRRVVVTQRPDLACPLVTALREHGAEVLEVPATRWVPCGGESGLERRGGREPKAGEKEGTTNNQHPTPNTQFRQTGLDGALGRLESYDWILFTNPQGIDFFFERFFRVYHDLRQLGPARLGAYGPRTGRRLREWHLQPAALAADHKTPLIMEAITKCGSVPGQRFLVLRGDVAHEKVPEALKAAGAEVEVVPCYTVQAETEDVTGGAEALLQEGADWIVFASGLAIEHFHQRFDLPGLLSRFPRTRLAIANRTIRWALDKLGVRPSAISQPDDPQDMVDTILQAETEAQEDRPIDLPANSRLIKSVAPAR